MPSERSNKLLEHIFLPNISDKVAEYKASRKKFVHYTSATAALNMLETKVIWLRNTRHMNDFSEIEHGIEHLREFFGDADRCLKIINTFNKFEVGILEKAVAKFNDVIETVHKNTYLASISEHLSSEDRYGRLSMWRAYGGQDGSVAIVLNPGPFFEDSDAFQSYSIPALYHFKTDLKDEVEKLQSRFEDNIDVIQSKYSRETICGYLVHFLLLTAIASKHPGFLEEKEWRVFHLPTITMSERVTKTVENIRGNEETVYKIPLQDFPDENMQGIEIPRLIDKIIIGPSGNPSQIKESIVARLEAEGVAMAAEKVIVSTIPLRIKTYKR